MPPRLERRLGVADAAALVISNVIGVGIFTTPGIVCAMLPRPAAILAVWALGGFLALSGAMAYAELAALKPKAGGEYVYLREGFGRLAAFLTGWTSFVAGFSGAIAAGAIGLTAYLGRFFPAAANPAPIWSLSLGRVSATLSRPTILALACIVALGAVHIRGVRPGRVVQDSLAAAQILGLLLFIVLGFAMGNGSLENLTSGERPRPSSWLLALIPVMFSYSGWNAAAYVAEEVREPGRNVPRALGWGTVAVIAIYLGLNALYLYALPVGELSGRINAADAVADRLLGPAAAESLAVLAILIILASLSAMTLAGPRIYYAMARDGVFFPAAARIHPKFGTPAVAIAAQTAWSCLLVLSGTFEQLLTYTGFAIVLFSAVAVCALFVLRWKTPEAHRPFRAWGYPIAPAIFALASLAIVVNAILEAPLPSAIGLLVMAAGVPLYWLMRRRSRRSGQNS
ncbi:MAG TPA: amino acid permease [Thermoanaerobaculia bacterium]|jgi:APA family basic amino acid/polyamine antiporter